MSLIGNNVITLRQLAAYIDELRMQIVDLISYVEEVDEAVFDVWVRSNEDEPLVLEYQTLESDFKQLEKYIYPDELLIHEEAFDSWIMDHLHDLGEIPDNPPFVIDQDATVDMYRRDCKHVDINGEPYLYA